MFLIIGEKLQEVNETVEDNNIVPIPFFHLVTSDENKAKAFIEVKKAEALSAIEYNKMLAKEIAAFNFEFPAPSIPASVTQTQEMKSEFVKTIIARKDLFEKKFKYRKFMDVCKWHYEPVSII